MYEMPANDYNKLLHSNITKTYQKCQSVVINNINKEVKAIAKSLNLDAKIERYADRRAFITIKDHKPNFPHNLKCRLINPAKSEMGSVKSTLKT